MDAPCIDQLNDPASCCVAEHLRVELPQPQMSALGDVESQDIT
jgi:hypothetical protein